MSNPLDRLFFCDSFLLATELQPKYATFAAEKTGILSYTLINK